MNLDDDKIRSRIATALLDRLRIYNFVHVFEEHMPDLTKLMRESIDGMFEKKFTPDLVVKFLEDMFDKESNGVLAEYTWLKPYCFLYARSLAKKYGF